MNLEQSNLPARRKIAFSIWAIFLAEFASLLFANARNIAQPGMIAEFDGMALFSWLIALPALAGAAATLLFGKLSDVYGRRALILFSIAIFSVGLVISASSTSMVFLVVSTTFMTIGHFPILPLCFAVVGDLFPPSQRARWTGLLNLPVGFSALLGPVLGGIVTESALGWRGLFWGTIPLILVAGGMVAFALPDTARKVKPRVDVLGTVVMVVATTTLILGFSWLGVPNKFGVGALLLLISLGAWIVFIQIEKQAEAPILDLQVLFNRTFVTAAVAGLLSFFGTVAISAYSPIFVQEVMAVSPTLSGSMLTPFSTLLAFMGVPVGFLLAKTRKYRGMFVIGYAVVTLALLAMWRFTGGTPIWVYMLVTGVAGAGLGMFSTINAVVAQFAVPKELLGVAVGAVFFFQMVGIAVSPAILGFAQSSLPDLESGLKLVFLVSAAALAAALLLIMTIPEIPLEADAAEMSEPLELVSEG
ncbi:MAG: MFS transporter [Anaerolineales bacterium]|jgi:MFS family permease|nr:MFS transporter [Anaerolineales bacterium]